jgi:hypothetical protein
MTFSQPNQANVRGHRTSSSPGQHHFAEARLLPSGWAALRVLAWVFAALFIAGFTSAVRKT